MVGKTSIGGGAAGVLDYCYLEKDKKNDKSVRGEILFCQNLTLQKLQNDNKIFDMKNLAKQFDEIASLNTRMQKFIWHQSFSFPIDEKPTTEQIQEIILEFSKEFGFEDNQLIAFRHSDTAHEHFHIVANRLNKDGINTANQYNNFRRVGQFCRRMEQKLGLKLTLGMISDPKQKRKENVGSSRNAIFIKSKIDEYLLLVNSIKELKEALLKEEIETEIGRGISFKYQNERFKGSDLGREYSLMNLSKRLALNPSRINEVENDVKSESISKDKPEDKKQEVKSSSTNYNFVEQGSAGRRPNFKDEEKEEEKNRKKAFKFKR